jgi:S1-C subfamily serine protease
MPVVLKLIDASGSATVSFLTGDRMADPAPFASSPGATVSAAKAKTFRPGHLASGASVGAMPAFGGDAEEVFAMVETVSSLVALSDATAQLVEHAAGSIVSVRGGGRWHSSGIHWRPGVVVTAEEVLERDENIELTLPGGRSVEASLVGRDPTTDVAVLRFQPDGLATAATAATPLRAGEAIFAIGNYDGSVLAAFGIVALAGGAWRSSRGGTIDNFIRLDLTLSPTAEGGALVDAHGHVLGMTVLGPRRRALAIPTSTIERAVDQLLARGHVFRAYLGAGLRPLKGERRQDKSPASSSGRGVLVVDIDPEGPAKRAGLFVGDVITSWNGRSIDRVRDVVHLLGPESVGSTVDLALVRGGASATLQVILGERPIR